MRVMGIAHVYVARGPRAGGPVRAAAAPTRRAWTRRSPAAPIRRRSTSRSRRSGATASRGRSTARPGGSCGAPATRACASNHFAFSRPEPLDPAREPDHVALRRRHAPRRDARVGPGRLRQPVVARTATAGRAASTRPASTASTARCTPSTCRSTCGCADAAQELSVRRSSKPLPAGQQGGDERGAEADDAEHGEHEQHDREDGRARRWRARGSRRGSRAPCARGRSGGGARGRTWGTSVPPGGVDPAARLRWDGSVPKYDAFGREIGEDTLAGPRRRRSAASAARSPPTGRGAGRRGGASARPPPATRRSRRRRREPAAAADAELRRSRRRPAPVAVVRRRRGSGLGCLVGLVVLVAIVAVPIVALVSFVGDAGDTIDEITGVLDSGPDVDTMPGAGRAGQPAKPPSGLGGASMVARANFGKALKRLGRAGPGRRSSASRPDRVDAQLVKGSRAAQRAGRLRGRARPRPGRPRTAANLGTIALSDDRPLGAGAARARRRRRASPCASRASTTWCCRRSRRRPALGRLLQERRLRARATATARSCGRSADREGPRVRAPRRARATAASWAPGAQPPGGE